MFRIRRVVCQLKAVPVACHALWQQDVQIQFSVNSVALLSNGLRSGRRRAVGLTAQTLMPSQVKQSLQQFQLQTLNFAAGLHIQLHNSHEICKDTRILQRPGSALTLTQNELRPGPVSPLSSGNSMDHFSHFV